jgi:hypothetical protein
LYVCIKFLLLLRLASSSFIHSDTNLQYIILSRERERERVRAAKDDEIDLLSSTWYAAAD